MKLQIIKPPKGQKIFVTLRCDGYMFFGADAVECMNLSADKEVVVAHDEYGALYVKTVNTPCSDGFRVYARKNGTRTTTCIRITDLLRCFGTGVEKSTRYNLIEAEDEFYRVDGLKLKLK